MLLPFLSLLRQVFVFFVMAVEFYSIYYMIFVEWENHLYGLLVACLYKVEQFFLILHNWNKHWFV